MKHYKFKQALKFDLKDKRHFFGLGVHQVPAEVEATDLFKVLHKKGLVVEMGAPAANRAPKAAATPVAPPPVVPPQEDKPDEVGSVDSSSVGDSNVDSHSEDEMNEDEMEEATKPEGKSKNKKKR